MHIVPCLSINCNHIFRLQTVKTVCTAGTGHTVRQNLHRSEMSLGSHWSSARRLGGRNRHRHQLSCRMLAHHVPSTLITPPRSKAIGHWRRCAQIPRRRAFRCRPYPPEDTTIAHTRARQPVCPLKGKLESREKSLHRKAWTRGFEHLPCASAYQRVSESSSIDPWEMFSQSVETSIIMRERAGMCAWHTCDPSLNMASRNSSKST